MIDKIFNNKFSKKVVDNEYVEKSMMYLAYATKGLNDKVLQKTPLKYLTSAYWFSKGIDMSVENLKNFREESTRLLEKNDTDSLCDLIEETEKKDLDATSTTMLSVVAGAVGAFGTYLVGNYGANEAYDFVANYMDYGKVLGEVARTGTIITSFSVILEQMLWGWGRASIEAKKSDDIDVYNSMHSTKPLEKQLNKIYREMPEVIYEKMEKLDEKKERLIHDKFDKYNRCVKSFLHGGVLVAGLYGLKILSDYATPEVSPIIDKFKTIGTYMLSLPFIGLGLEHYGTKLGLKQNRKEGKELLYKFGFYSNLKEYENNLCSLINGEETDENRIQIIENTRGLYGMLRNAKNNDEYDIVEKTLNASRGLLRMKYRDTLSLDFVPPPRND